MFHEAVAVEVVVVLVECLVVEVVVVVVVGIEKANDSETRAALCLYFLLACLTVRGRRV